MFAKSRFQHAQQAGLARNRGAFRPQDGQGKKVTVVARESRQQPRAQER
jgi:hypothetical protein